MKTKLLYLSILLCYNALAQFPTNNLIAQYGFDSGNLLVDGANGQNFIQTGTALSEINDRFGNSPTSAIQLNGDYLTRPDITFGDFHSYSFWIKTATTSSTRQVIIDDSNRNTTNSTTWTGTRITMNNGNVDVSIRYRISTRGSLNYRGLTSISPIDIRDGKWHHIAVLLECRRSVSSSSFAAVGSTRIFVDGVLQDFDDDRFGSSSIHTGINGNGNLTVANNRSNSLPVSEMYDGVIDDILIYDKSLSTAEIQSIISFNNYCFAPSESILSVNSITNTSATVNIANNANTFDIAYHKTSEPFSNATIIPGIISGSTTSQASLTGLDTFTDYQVYVREQCSNITDWSNAITFKTTRQIGKIYVNTNATGANNGLSWADAYTDLQDALTNAFANEDIWVAAGTYYPHASSRNTYFQLDKDNLKIYGGFDGTETQLSDRVFGSNETILSGDLNNNDINVSDFANNYANTSRNGDNSYHIVNITANNILLDRLTISDAHNNLSATEQGGAIVKSFAVADLTIKNCIIKNNVSRNACAGLITEFNLNNASLTPASLIVENCQFVNNMSRWGAGIYSYIRNNTKVNITITNCLFDANLVDDLSASLLGFSGSAVWLRNVGNASSELNSILTGNTFVNNIDLGTDQSLNNSSRAIVALSKNTTAVGITSAQVANSVFWNNKTVGNAATRSITDLYKSPLNSLTVINSIDEANFNDNSISSKTNTISSDPLFTDLVNGDYTLSALSPAIDTGNNSNVFGSLDLLGNQRIFNTNVDMGAYEFSSVTLGLNDFQNNKNNISLYPNPTTTVLNIKMDKILKQASIYSVLGQEVLKTQHKTINIDNLKNGIYLIKIEDENGVVSTKRFVKQKN